MKIKLPKGLTPKENTEFIVTELNKHNLKMIQKDGRVYFVPKEEN